MLRLHTIVVALDFSPGSAAAAVRAADLARRTGAALHVFHADVLFRSSGDGSPPEDAPSSALRLRVERFAADALGLSADAFDALGPTVVVARDVSAPAALLQYAVDAQADLLVLGTHGRSGLDRLLLGSVAEACVSAAPCPVLAVPERAGDRAPAPDAPVLVPVDFSERSEAALQAGRTLADLFGAPLEVLHTVRDAGPYPAFAPDVLSLVDVDPEQAEAVRARLARFAEAAAPAAVHVALGAPSRIVPALAADRGVGAIVMGTHGRSGIAHALLGSVAEATLRRAPCPVLTLTRAERLTRRARRPVASALTP